MYVAAGGGGDVLAAAMLHAARGRTDRLVVATMAWDRLLIDPLPGPRGINDFTGLRQIAAHVHAVTGRTRPIPPAGSTLPRLAADLDVDLLLLDPYQGGRGLERQLHAAAEHYAPDTVTLVDVGGDVVAHGDEASLKSPTADMLALTAVSTLAAPGLTAETVVLGPGLDGELPGDYVRERIAQLGGGPERRVTAPDVAPIAPLLTWHPSEASGMLAAAAGSGARGVAEVRDAGTQILLTDESTAVYRVDAAALAEDALLPAPLRATTDFGQVESLVREVCGACEMDYERRKAATLAASPRADADPAGLEQRVLQVERAATGRGSDYITLRRLAEAAGAPRGGEPYAAWRAELIARRPHRYVEPLWAVHDQVTIAA
jgi:hypothetical protein